MVEPAFKYAHFFDAKSMEEYIRAELQKDWHVWQINTTPVAGSNQFTHHVYMCRGV